MVAVPEDDTFPETVYRIETSDPVVGGPPNEATGAGLINIPTMLLAKRTRWLKIRVDALMASLVEATTAVAGIVRLSTATNSTSATEAATPSAVKAAMDNANTRVPVTRSVSAGGIATGGGTLAGDLIVNVIEATQAEAEAGLIQTRAMTPLRVAQAILARLGGRTISTAGLASGGGTLAGDLTIAVTDATQAEAEAGTSATVSMSPLRVAQAIVARIAAGTLQAGSALLTSFSVPRGNGIIVQLGAQTIGTRAVIGGAGIDVTNGDGVAGNPTVAINAAALAAATFGNGHVWGNFTGSRAINGVYQNTTGRPIMVSIDLTGGNTTGDLAVSVDNVTWLTVCNRSLDGNAEWFSTIVPQGNYYRLTGNITISTWAELR